MKHDGKQAFVSHIFSYIILFALGVFFFCFLGQRGYILFDDAPGYMAPNLREGIMPIYSFFLNSLRVLVGVEYLRVAAFIQGIICTVCTVAFACYFKRIFELNIWELYLVWVLTLLPFSVELPSYVTSHVIYSESLAYPLYYIFAILYYKLIWCENRKEELQNLLGALVLALILSLIRTQLMILFLIIGTIVFYKVMCSETRIVKRLFCGVSLLILCTLIGVMSTYMIRNIYIRTVGNWFLERYTAQEGADGDKESFSVDNQKADRNESENEKGIEIVLENGECKINIPERYLSDVEIVRKQEEYEQNSGGQITNALLCRTFYEADEEDINLYKTPMMKHVFSMLYNECNAAGVLHNNVPKGLWSWKNMTNTDIYKIYHDRVIYVYFHNPDFAHEIPDELYYQETKVANIIIATQLIAHPIRFLYRCIRIMIPGFISCVFFNIERIYVLCHIITLLLYVVVGCLSSYLYKRGWRKEAIVSIANLYSCLIFVGTINLIFLGMQRYFLYQMGTFYCGFYIMIRKKLKE